MKEQQTQSSETNNSSFKTQILALQKALRTQSGTVTYVFEEEFITPEGSTEIVETSRQSMPINPILSDSSLSKVLDLFRETAWDLGASTFIIN